MLQYTHTHKKANTHLKLVEIPRILWMMCECVNKRMYIHCCMSTNKHTCTHKKANTHLKLVEIPRISRITFMHVRMCVCIKIHLCIYLHTYITIHT